MFTQRLIFLLALVWLSVCSSLVAQPLLYGLNFVHDPSSSDPFEGFERFGSLDLSTGAFNVLDTLPGVLGVNVGTSTFDHVQGRYLFSGADSTWQYRLYSVQVSTAALLSQPGMTRIPIELEYNMNTGELYGMEWDQVQQLEYLVTVDLQRGTTQRVGVVGGVESIRNSSSTLNSNNGTLYFLGLDTASVQRLYKINTVNGQILSNPVLQGNLYGFQYDVTQNRLFALHRLNRNSPFELVEIDTLTGTFTLITAVPGMNGPDAGLPAGPSTYDQNTGTYIFRGVQAGNDSIYLIPVRTGLIQALPLAERVIEIEADNTQFAARFYNHGSTSIPGGELFSDLKVYPNPVRQDLILTMEQPLQAAYTLYSPTGQIVFRDSFQQFASLDLSSLPVGIYLLEVYASGSRVIQRVVKQ